jgi:hypothetical protein
VITTSGATLTCNRVFLRRFCFLRTLSFPVKPVSSSSCSPSSSERSFKPVLRSSSPINRSLSPPLGSSAMLSLPRADFTGLPNVLALGLLFEVVSRLFIRLLRRRLCPSPSISVSVSGAVSGVCSPARAAAALGAFKSSFERRGDLDDVLDRVRLGRGN